MVNFWDGLNESEKIKRFEEELPVGLNKDLIDAYIKTSLIGPPFMWKKRRGGYFLKGFQNCELIVEKDVKGSFFVQWKDVLLDEDLGTFKTLEEAFAVAQDFAFKKREAFAFSDREAPAKQKPISEKQLKVFKDAGYTDAIQNLTNGQCSTLFNSGILYKNKKPQTQGEQRDF